MDLRISRAFYATQPRIEDGRTLQIFISILLFTYVPRFFQVTLSFSAIRGGTFTILSHNLTLLEMGHKERTQGGSGAIQKFRVPSSPDLIIALLWDSLVLNLDSGRIGIGIIY